MSLDVWFGFILASLLLTMTPGPSIFLGMVHAVNYGAKKVVYTALGDVSANFLQMMAVAVGLGVVLAASATAFEVIKWFGVVTLLYLGAKMILAKPPVSTEDQASALPPISPWQMFSQGFLVAAGNPKALVFFTAFFPQFINPSEPLLFQMLILCPTMMVLDFCWVMIYAHGAGRMRSQLLTRPRLVNRVSGSVLVFASAVLALNQRS